MIESGQGDLLQAGVEALVNPVNTAGLMDNGPALRIKGAFPDNFNAYRRACVTGQLRLGEVLVFDLGKAQPRYILNVATKSHSRSISSLAHVDAGLAEIVGQVTRLAIPSVAVPAIGCDLGGLPWRIVRPRIEAAFAPLHDVRVVIFPP